MTKFDNFISKLLLEDFSRMVVKAVIINSMDPYYLTSSGQLYPFTPEGYKQALRHEVAFWAQQEEKPETTVESNPTVSTTVPSSQKD